MLSPAQNRANWMRRCRIFVSAARDVPDRQRTMEATLAWSWSSRARPNAPGLARPSVFADGFDQAAARSAIVFGSLVDADVTELLISFVDKSLVVIDPVNHHRARLLETVRTYARLRLRESGDLASHCGATLDHYLGQFGPEGDAHDAAAISAGSEELENLSALIEVIRDADAERARRLRTP